MLTITPKLYSNTTPLLVFHIHNIRIPFVCCEMKFYEYENSQINLNKLVLINKYAHIIKCIEMNAQLYRKNMCEKY